MYGQNGGIKIMLRIVDVIKDEISAEEFGGKAHGISLLYKCGCRIPKTLAIQATNTLEDINSLEFRENLLEKLAFFSENGMYDLAVRSSCTLEDDFANSMAGHFDTFIGEMNIEDVFVNIREIISSIQKIGNGKMGVIIQNRIPAEYAGVLFSSNPITYSKKQMCISYVNGMGNKLVSGEECGTDVIVAIDDENFLIDTEMDVFLKKKLLLLARESKQIERALKYPLDIEWAIMGTKVYFLQCRPLASITRVLSGVFPVNKQSVSKIPMQLISHDKIKLRLAAQESDIFISDAHVYIRNSCFDELPVLDISKSGLCKGYSVVIVYPRHLSNKVVRSFVGDKKKVFESIKDCCRYGIRSFPEYEDLGTCLNGYFELLSNEYWISATIIQEIFDPLYTGVIQRLDEGYIIEITRGHFLTKGTVPTSQYIVSKAGKVLERTEVHQEAWLKIIEGHVVHCVCNNEDESLVALGEGDVKYIIDSFLPILKMDSNVVEFGLLKRPNDILKPYLIDFVDDNSPISISSNDIMGGIISYGRITGKPVIIKELEKDSLNEHFYNISKVKTKSDEKIVFFCKNPELALLKVIEGYDPKSIGFVFQNCAIGTHLAVVLREKGIPAIKLDAMFWRISQKNSCTIDAETHGLLAKERLRYE